MISQVGGAKAFVGAVTFDGHSTSGHDSAGSAIPASFGRTLQANFTWTVPLGGAAATVTAVRLYLRLLGVSIATKEVDIQNAQPTPAGGWAGNVSLVEDLSQYTYLVEGLYLANADVYANGTSTLLWSESFYIAFTGPAHLTVVAVLLVVIVAYEGYEIASIRRQARSVQRLSPDSASEARNPARADSEDGPEDGR